MNEHAKTPDAGTVPIMVPVWEEMEADSEPIRGAENETFQQESKATEWVARRFRRKSTVIENVKLDEASYNRICTQVLALVAEQEKAENAKPSAQRNGGFRVDEIKVSLGVHAQGTIAFVAEVGAEASIEVTFKRQ